MYAHIQIPLWVCVYIYICMYTHIHIHTYMLVWLHKSAIPALTRWRHKDQKFKVTISSIVKSRTT